MVTPQSMYSSTTRLLDEQGRACDWKVTYGKRTGSDQQFVEAEEAMRHLLRMLRGGVGRIEDIGVFRWVEGAGWKAVL